MDGELVTIGQAAALYGLATSTLRWWDRQGVVTATTRRDGARLYAERELRKIGITCLCRNTGLLSLDQAAFVASGRASVDEWHDTVDVQITELDDQIDRLTAARDYLHHMRICGHDDPADCPHVDTELIQHTPRGRFKDHDLVAAARLAALPAARHGGRHAPH